MISSKNSKNIAIFGATSHIAKNLILQFSNENENHLHLFSRNNVELQRFIFNIGTDKQIDYYNYDVFDSKFFDVIINCIGISDPFEINKHEFEILTLTEKYDNIILNYLKEHNSCQYLNFSSGIVYDNFHEPITDESNCTIKLNDALENPYRLSKIYSESKHRLLNSFNIIDIRIFNFFSRFLNLKTHFFISEVILSILENKKLYTTNQNFVRDYIHPQDLFNLIKLCIKNPTMNSSIDAYSKSPISKFDILKEFSKRYSLQYSVTDNLKNIDFKEKYFSLSRKAEIIGYVPRYTSLDTLLDESKFIVAKNNI